MKVTAVIVKSTHSCQPFCKLGIFEGVSYNEHDKKATITTIT